jgi:hypothetical protein
MRDHWEGPDHIDVVRSKPFLCNDPKVGNGRLRAFAVIAPSDFTQAWDALLGVRKGNMAATDPGAGADEPTGRVDDFVKYPIERSERHPSHRTGAHDASLQLGNFSERSFDAILDRTDLSGDSIGGIFDHLFAHDCSFPGARAAEWLSV